MQIINKKGVFRLPVLILAMLLAACWLVLFIPGTASAAISVTITGDGVTTPTTWDQAALEAMPQVQSTYSTINTWPTKKWYVAEGVRLADLLTIAGIKEDAKIIKVTAADGYKMTFTKKELMDDTRYYYPGLKDNDEFLGYIPGSTDGAVPVDTILALMSVEGSDDPAGMTGLNAPLLVMGQRYVTEQTNNAFVKYVRTIEVSTETPATWETPIATPGSGTVAAGTQVALSTSDMDGDNIHYTTDGSDPGIDDPMYNWIKKRWWTSRADDLAIINHPITVDQSMTIKTRAIGFGKYDSPIASFDYVVLLLTPPALTADTTGNILGQAVDITFTEDAAWRAAVTDITLNGTSIAGQYTVTEGNINIAAGAFTTAGDYTVVVSAAGYYDSIVVQQLLLDTTAPVITLTGDNPQTIEVGGVYEELGATVTDNYDTGLSAVIDSSAVNTSVVGVYYVTYDATDSSGNAADQVTRTVNVVDSGKPVITMLGSSPVSVEVGSVYTDAGATASDSYDGDLTSAIVTVNNVDTSEIGSYSVTYNVTDCSGNAADQVTRTVNVVDSGKPVITMLGSSPVSVEVGSVYTDAGATASDSYDGDLTSSIVTVNNVDTSEIGSYSVTYNVTDSSGNAADQVTRTVNVVDSGKPVITMLGSSPVSVEVGSVYTDAGATASDSYDGDLTSDIVTLNNVDTSEIGSYSVTYNVTDSSGNAADQVTRTVNVVDSGKPVITMLGSSPVSIEVGGVYTDAGATASDSYDGDLTSDIVTLNNVDTSEIGSYSVTYNVTDSSGNAADQVTRTVNVVDSGKPVITMLGSSPVSVEVGSVYTDAGATASDSYDGDLTSAIVTVNNVDTSEIGSYSVTYNVTDSSGNAADQVTRTVNVVDSGKPVITMLGSSPVSVEVGSVYTDAGATASDSYDGDLTSDIVTVNNVDTSEIGSYSVTYNVTDSSGNAADQVTRTVNVVDSGKPVITMLGSSPVSVEVGSVYTDAGATASDSYDGDLTSDIVTVNNVDTSEIGSYSVTYNVTDSSGNAADQVTRTVNVVDTTAPVITLTGDNPQTIEVGGAYTELGATVTDNYDTGLSAVIDSSAVNTSEVGVYYVTYDATDSSGNAADQVTRTVNVVPAPDTTAPVITLTGDNPQTIEVGGVYEELGATVTDNYDTGLSAVIDSSAVNTSEVGVYYVTYDATDSSGNAADQVTRTVNVVDSGKPVITMLGSSPVSVEVGSVYNDAGATASDSYDGDLTSAIVTVNNVDTSEIGSYSVTYNVTDSSGNAADQVTRTVNVVDTTAPVITLTGDNPQTIEVGGAYTELGATVTDNYDTGLSAVIDSSAVNTSEVGVYYVTYDATDSSGNAADQVTRTVNVVDSGKPVITMLGSSPVSVEVGSVYTDAGATASDSYDGDLTSSIVTVNNVDTSEIGSYSVTYNVTDSSGNAADQVTRTVNVVDSGKPVITMLGSSPVSVEVGSVYTDAGATASDSYDGDLTSAIVTVNNVDTSEIGSYSVTYNVTDSSGNAADQVTRTVNVVDSGKPVITMLGSSPVSVEVGSVYTDAGATASDSYDGDLTSSIVTVNNVDTSEIGSYSVTYNVTDSSGNAADQVTRTVNVVDSGKPVITMLGSSPVSVEVGSVYTDAGATASDSYDGDLTSDIVTVNNVDTSEIGSYSVTYNVTDSSGNAADQVTRTVNVVDSGKPVITMLGSSPVSVEVGSVYTDAGATASDSYDGDLTSDIVTVNNVDTSEIGSYSVTYNVTDSSGNAADQVTRTVNVVDSGKPVITMLGSSPVSVEVGSVYTDAGATASDSYDGDLTSAIVTVNNVDTSEIGSYSVTYNVTDSSGNAADQVTRTVNVVDSGKPVITMLGSSPVSVEVGSVYTDAGATASDSYDGDLTSDIVTVNNVDTSEIGSYSVTYNVTDSSGNAADQVTRTVNVVDSGKPVITMLGSSPVSVEVGSVYTDAGATASDSYDGDLTSDIVTVNNVDTSVVGSYSVTYNVTDSSGNAADQVTRTVNVVDTTAPVITLTGDNPQTIEVGGAYTELGATVTDNYDTGLSAVIDSSAVNTSEVGVYYVTYDATDSSGNAADQVTRTVNVVPAPDTTAPVITLTGDNPQTIEVGGVYEELGATVTDNYDTGLSAVIDSSAVNTSVVGVYYVTYDATDSSGNAADQVTRTVNVVDTTAPVITLTGDNPQTIQVGGAYTELGATVTDNYDTGLSAVIDSSAVNTSVVGVYYVTYDATDSSGNAADQVTRTVNVVPAPDTTAPVITLTGDNPQTIEVGGVYEELGATVTDNYDTGLSAVIDSSAVNTSVVGVYYVTYDATDSSGNAADQVTRTVNVVDSGKPVITMLGSSPVSVEVGSVYNDAGATASDSYDGDLTSSIVTVNNVDTSEIGSYSVTYNVTDSSGNAADQVTRTVNVVPAPDTTAPVITLTGDNPQTIEVGGAYTELGATVTDNYDTGLSAVIDSSAVKTSEVGVYYVTYDATDSSGNAAEQVTRTVNVVDTTAPVITLTGDNPQTIEVGGAYTELGATVTDNYDTGLSAVIDSSAVNTSEVGVYYVTYDANDSSGNAADQAVRTVNVIEITLLTPPDIISDDTDNTVGQAITITFVDNKAWRAVVNEITVDGNSIAGQYKLARGKITINAGVFPAAGDYEIVVKATGYTDASVIQPINAIPMLTPPILTADTTGNTIGAAIDIKFKDNPAWRSAITDICIDDASIAGNYTIARGKITIDASVFPTAGDYEIVVKATGYTDASVIQPITAIPMLTPPILTADTTGNTIGAAIDIKFKDNPAWRSAITDICIDDASIAGNYTIARGKITIDASVFPTAGDYEIVVKATGYTDASVIQPITAIPTLTPPTLMADTTGNTVGAAIDIKFKDNAAWRAAIMDVCVDGVSIAGNYTIARGKITIDASVFPTAGNYEIVVKAAGYFNATVIQPIK